MGARMIAKVKFDTCKQGGVLKLGFSSISTLAQSPSHSPSKSPTQAPAPKASVPSPTVRKTPVLALSPTMVNSPPSPPSASSEASVSSPSLISTPPSEALGLAQSGAVLNRVGFTAGFVAVAVFVAVLVF
ncbi:classical arabinogalactan protein 1-like [Quercus lobata]|uniref:classical arabinogalactan protein 1-like n=1 Tax=Quercus lobata TaxID=97700 RepID=UPI00124550AA|nr:classical arabinogalactan protein 1-like [Quercus lobata]